MIGITANAVCKDCIKISECRFKNLNREQNIPTQCSKCKKNIEPGQLIISYCGHTFGKDCIKNLLKMVNATKGDLSDCVCSICNNQFYYYFLESVDEALAKQIAIRHNYKQT